MLDAKFIADLITLARGFLGLILVWLGATQGEQSLPIAIFIMLLCWTGDFVDGGIAHMSKPIRHTRIGDSDIYVDLFVSLCLGAYLIFAGFATVSFGVCYLIGWLIALWKFGLDKNLLMLIQAPIYLALILIGLRLHPASGIWLVAWLIIATAINWKRFSHKIVPEFIHGMRSLWNGFGGSHHSS